MRKEFYVTGDDADDDDRGARLSGVLARRPGAGLVDVVFCFFLRLDGELKGVADLEDVYASNCCVIAVWARIGKGTAMDWQAISAVGSLLCAAATFFAALVALMIGLRERKTSVCARGYFLEDKRFDLIEHHPNCFKIEFICDGSQPVYITHILERARFRFCIRGMKCWFESKACCRKHGMYGRDLPNLKSRKYWALYPLRGVMKLEPGEIGRFTISFSKMRTVQEERKELGFLTSMRRCLCMRLMFLGKDTKSIRARRRILLLSVEPRS